MLEFLGLLFVAIALFVWACIALFKSP